MAQTGNSTTVTAWNTVLFDKFSRFRHLAVAGLAQFDAALCTQLRGCDPHDVRVGMRVHVEFDDVTPECSLPHWRIE